MEENKQQMKLGHGVPDELWARIKDYPDYFVSNQGRVKSVRNGPERMLKQAVKAKHGYLYVSLYRFGERKQDKLNVHRLVALHFVPNPFGRETVDHINGIKTDNRADNLRWLSPGANIEKYMERAGHKHKPNFKGWEAE